MSKSDKALDFSHLDEETDTDAVIDSEIRQHDVGMDIIQPHLSALSPPPSTDRRRNPRERGIVIVDEESREITYQDASTGQAPVQPAGSDTVAEGNEQTFDHNLNHVTHQNHSVNSDIVHDASATASNASNGSASERRVQSNSIQILYSKNSGNIGVREVPVTTRPDGSPYIATQQIPQNWDENERRPLRKSRIRLVKIFSVIACILFFPCGIPAAYFAFRIDREFEEGVLRGNIDRAQKFAVRSERLSILAVVMCILTAALVVTLIERPHFQSEHYPSGTVTG